MRDDPGFARMFNPRTIAIVGVSRSGETEHPGYTGSMFLRMLKDSGYKGRLYPVNPKASVIEGVKVYPSVTSIPEPLDFVIIAVPAVAVPQVLEDCVTVGAFNVHVCTAGFGETGQPEGKLLEQRVKEIALRGKLRLIGPNCMGCHVPAVGMRMFLEVPLVHGPVAVISQSGGHAYAYLRHDAPIGIGFSKVISFGNALVLEAPDFLEYLATDPESKIICMYLEGIRNGRRLIELVKRINREKPVIVWKGGLTSSGRRAAASHTGSMAGDERMWDAFFKQTGAIKVGSIEEMADVTMTILKLNRQIGDRVAVLGGGGGNNVATGDICAQEGLDMPALSPETISKLTGFISLVNQAVVNPLDIAGVIGNMPLLKRVLAAIVADPRIDTIILSVSPGFWTGASIDGMVKVEGHLSDLNLNIAGGKPLILTVHDQGKAEETVKAIREMREAGMTVYTSLRGACRALRRVADYYKFLAQKDTVTPAQTAAYRR